MVLKADGSVAGWGASGGGRLAGHSESVTHTRAHALEIHPEGRTPMIEQADCFSLSLIVSVPVHVVCIQGTATMIPELGTDNVHLFSQYHFTVVLKNN